MQSEGGLHLLRARFRTAHTLEITRRESARVMSAIVTPRRSAS
jgi:hypothetical protein